MQINQEKIPWCQRKQEVKLDENSSKVQALWQFNQFTKSLWGRLSKLVCDFDNMELIFFFSSTPYQTFEVSSDNIMMTLLAACSHVLSIQ